MKPVLSFRNEFFSMVVFCLVKLICVLPLSLFVFGAQAGTSICFKANLRSNKTLNLKFATSEENPNEGVIRYKNGSTDIKITKISTKNVAPKSQVPATVLSKWKEEYEGKTTGYYYLTTHGTLVGGLQYVRSRDKKSFEFYDDQQNTELNCSWD